MGKLKLFGMKAAYDEVLTTAVKRQHEPQRVVGDLLTAEISEKQARSIKYQMTIARLPLAKEIDEFDFVDTPINETLARDLVGGDFLQHQRNVVLIGGTGTGKTHLAVAVARACIRNGARGRFFNSVDLVNKLDAVQHDTQVADFVSLGFDAERYYTMLGEAMREDDDEEMSAEMRDALSDIIAIAAEFYERLQVDVTFTERGIEIDTDMTLAD